MRLKTPEGRGYYPYEALKIILIENNLPVGDQGLP